MEIHVIDTTGRAIIVPSYERSARWTYCCDAVRLLPYFADAIQWRKMAGVNAYLMPAAVFLSRLLRLARLGIHMYGFHFPGARSLERNQRAQPLLPC